MPTSTADPEQPLKSRHLPMAVAQDLYNWVKQKRIAGDIDGDELRVIDQELAQLMNICGGCERIARTPLVKSYRVFARQCIFLFLVSFPWGVAEDFQWWTIPLTLTVSYFMFGMEIVAEHVEDPFGLDDDDLDLESLCQTIEKSVREVFQTAPQLNEISSES
jgi:putative membrane protein